MKKMVAMLLIAVICLGLVACGGPKEVDPATAIVGKWQDADGKIMQFDANHGGTVVAGGMELTCSWQYMEADGNFLVDYTAGNDRATVTQNEDGSLVLTWMGKDFKRIG